MTPWACWSLLGSQGCSGYSGPEQAHRTCRAVCWPSAVVGTGSIPVSAWWYGLPSVRSMRGSGCRVLGVGHFFLNRDLLENVMCVSGLGSGLGRDWPDAVVCVLLVQSCLTLCDPVDCSPSGSSVHGVLQARILEWVAICFSRGSSRPRDGARVSYMEGRSFTVRATREAQ